MSGVHFDNTEVEKLAKVLANAPHVLPAEAKAIVSKGALNIKTDARRMATGVSHAPLYPYSITYDTKSTLTEFSAEIGPDKGKLQGALGNIIEYGAPAQNTSPHPHMLPAAVKEIPKFEAALEAAAVKRLEG